MQAETETGGVESLGAAVNRIAGLMRHGGGLTTGDVAGLRRMDPRHPHASFFKLEGLALVEQLPVESNARLDSETRWAAVVVGLACLGDLHRPGWKLGRAMAELDVSELRFARLLRADCERLVDELPLLARFLAAKDAPADWSEAAWLILSSTRRDEERARRALARDYYRALSQPD